MLQKAIFGLFLISSFLYSAPCKKAINISSRDNTPLYEILHQISNTCKTSMVVEDAITLDRLKKPYKTLYINKGSFNKVVKLLLGRDFFYSIKNGILHISYLGTKIFKLNYISLARSSKSYTKLTLDSSTSSTGSSDSTSEDGGVVSVDMSSKFDFWASVKDNIQGILDKYPTVGSNLSLKDGGSNSDSILVINEKSGSLYLRSSKKQLLEVQKYINSVNKNISKQVLVDINIYQVRLSNERKTGIDWGQIQDFQNINADVFLTSNIGQVVEDVQGKPSTFNLSKSVNIDSILSFISTYGKTDSISNPRILAINNQTAIISIGKQIYYKIVQRTTTTTAAASTSSTGEQIESIFSGLIIDITPAISEKNELVLKINASITEVSNDNKNRTSKTGVRTIPPDLNKQEISTVISAKDDQKIILGGLISDSKLDGTKGIRWLSDIPLLGYFFGTDTLNEVKDELVIIITPKIITHDE